ncbi:MAG: SIR2 family protein [Microcystis sp. LE19-196.1B]|nr:SIR2 family protein [Microcystis sp. LE19-196.1B]
MKKRILFFLGAGASYPYLTYDGKNLSTAFLTDCLKNKNLLLAFQKLFFKLRQDEFSDNFYDFSVEDITKLIGEIEDILKNSNLYQNPNFEHIIHIIDKISLYNSSLFGERIQNIDLSLIDLFNSSKTISKFPKSEINGVSLIPAFIREYIIWIIIKCIENENEKKKYDKNLYSISSFYEYIMKKFGNISIYNLNYDPLILDALVVKNNIAELGTDENEEFSPSSFVKVKNPLCHLHGYVGNINFEDQRIILKKNYKNSQNERIKSYHSAQNRILDKEKSMKGYHFNTQIITGLDKFDSFSINPFSSYVHRFARETYSSSFIVMIGVGFEDYHLNSFLINTISTFNKKIIFVNKMSPEQVIDGLSLGINSPNLISNLLNRFNDKISVSGVWDYNNPNRLYEKYQNNLHSQLVQKGYGNLSNRMLIYIKGVEDFYKERDQLFDSI